MKFNIKLIWMLVLIILFSIALAIWARIEYIFPLMIFLIIQTVLFSGIAIEYTRRYLKGGNSEENMRVSVDFPHRRLVFFLWRVFWSLLILYSIAAFIRSMVIDITLIFSIGRLWFILIGLMFLLFAQEFLYNMRNDLSEIRNSKWVKRLIANVKPSELVAIHKEAEPYKLRITDTNPQFIRETLSCPTCIFDNEDASQKEQPWCNAPHPPEIKDDYCHSFEPRK